MNKSLGILLLFVFQMMVFCGEFGWAGEPVAVSGVIESAPAGQFFSTYFLREPNNGGLVAGLRDPQNQLLGADRHVTLMTEKLPSPDVNGLPVLRVISVLPNDWAQPSVWSRAQKGPGAYWGFHQRGQPKDFAGVPYTISRAYKLDNGLERHRFDIPSVSEAPSPLRSLRLTVQSDGIQSDFQAFAGLTYELNFLSSVDAAPQLISSITATFDGTLTFHVAPRQDSIGFFVIRAISP